MKHSKKIFALMLSLLTVISLTSCKDSAGIDFDTEGLTTVTYKINSGYIVDADGNKTEFTGLEYKNSDKDVVYYYDLKGGKSSKVINISDFSNTKIEHSKYKITGWYKDSNNSELWDFEKDLIQDGNDVVLYPKWESIIQFHYVIKYKDGNDIKELYSFNTKEGEKLSEFNINKNIENNAKTQNITWLGSFYSDADCTKKWDDSFKHPGEKEIDVPVYIDYIKGEYYLVKNYSDLNSAALSSSNIYLMNDIDCDGNKLSFKNYGGDELFGNVKFIGNGHTISNFIMTVNADRDSPNKYSNEYFDPDDAASNKNTLGVSLFGNSEYADFSDVTFKDFKFSINSYFDGYKYCVISPFAYRLANSSLKNVVMENCVVSIEKLTLYDSFKEPTFIYNENYDELKACNLVKIVFDNFSYDLSGTTIENSFIRNISFKEN